MTAHHSTAASALEHAATPAKPSPVLEDPELSAGHTTGSALDSSPAACSTPAAGEATTTSATAGDHRMPTIKTDHEHRENVDFTDYTTRGLVEHIVELLRDGDLILGDGDIDYAAADMLEILGVMHDNALALDLELLPQIRAFCITVLDDAGWTE